LVNSVPDEPESEDEAEVEVANDRPPHQTTSFVVAVDAGRGPDGGRIFEVQENVEKL
jgi:hypothetical protein